jgi:hypothetical protein
VGFSGDVHAIRKAPTHQRRFPHKIQQDGKLNLDDKLHRLSHREAVINFPSAPLRRNGTDEALLQILEKLSATVLLYALPPDANVYTPVVDNMQAVELKSRLGVELGQVSELAEAEVLDPGDLLVGPLVAEELSQLDVVCWQFQPGPFKHSDSLRLDVGSATGPEGGVLALAEVPRRSEFTARWQSPPHRSAAVEEVPVDVESNFNREVEQR